jgi:hypothetical protein
LASANPEHEYIFVFFADTDGRQMDFFTIRDDYDHYYRLTKSGNVSNHYRSPNCSGFSGNMGVKKPEQNKTHFEPDHYDPCAPDQKEPNSSILAQDVPDEVGCWTM